MVFIIIFVLLIRLFNIAYRDGIDRYERIKERAKKLYEIIDKLYKKSKDN